MYIGYEITESVPNECPGKYAMSTITDVGPIPPLTKPVRHTRITASNNAMRTIIKKTIHHPDFVSTGSPVSDDRGYREEETDPRSGG